MDLAVAGLSATAEGGKQKGGRRNEEVFDIPVKAT